jgi:DNA polymerase III subunit epsilon
MRRLRQFAIDVETANPRLSSICQIGLARYDGGALVEEWSSLIDPDDYLDDFNISIHGITQRDVKGKPKLPQVADVLKRFAGCATWACHTHFDRVAINKAYAKYDLTPPQLEWLDTAQVARRTWKEVSWCGYGLENLCHRIGYQFRHHDALEDAKAAAHVLLSAMNYSHLDLDSLKARVKQPIDPSRMSSGAALHRDGNQDGDLFGEVMVFTGKLQILRAEAADIAARLGCEVQPGVTKKTTMLVVGDQDLSKLAGHDKSSKQRRAEQLLTEGHFVRIIAESDFFALAALCSQQATGKTLSALATEAKKGNTKTAVS